VQIVLYNLSFFVALRPWEFVGLF